jgi:hypothetical protein
MTQTTDDFDPAPANESIVDDREAIAAVEGSRQAEPQAEPAGATAAASDAQADDTTSDESPLLDGELEEGIASVFAALYTAANLGEEEEAVASDDSRENIAAADVVTFRLLGELDRLWHRAA